MANMCCNTLQCVAVCCNVFAELGQGFAVSDIEYDKCALQCVVVCCSVFQSSSNGSLFQTSDTTNVCCSVLQCVCRAVTRVHFLRYPLRQMCVAVCLSVLQSSSNGSLSQTSGSTRVRCSVLQCVWRTRAMLHCFRHP